MKLYYFFLLLIFSSCTAEYTLKTVDQTFLFHDGNSKVWLIDEIKKEGKNYASLIRKERDIIIFYAPNKVELTSLKDIGYNKTNKATFIVDSEKNSIEVKFQKNNWKYKFESIGDEKIIMIPLDKKENQFELVLIPLPEF